MSIHILKNLLQTILQIVIYTGKSAYFCGCFFFVFNTHIENKVHKTAFFHVFNIRIVENVESLRFVLLTI